MSLVMLRYTTWKMKRHFQMILFMCGHGHDRIWRESMRWCGCTSKATHKLSTVERSVCMPPDSSVAQHYIASLVLSPIISDFLTPSATSGLIHWFLSDYESWQVLKRGHQGRPRVDVPWHSRGYALSKMAVVSPSPNLTFLSEQKQLRNTILTTNLWSVHSLSRISMWILTKGSIYCAILTDNFLWQATEAKNTQALVKKVPHFHSH